MNYAATFGLSGGKTTNSFDQSFDIKPEFVTCQNDLSAVGDYQEAKLK